MSEKSSKQFWNDRFEHLGGLPEHMLFDLARNDAAPAEYRLTAVEIMLKKGYKKAFHPELARFVDILEEEKAELQAAIPPVEHESEVKNTPENVDFVPTIPVNTGAPSASVTTATMFGTPPVHFPDDPVPENE